MKCGSCWREDCEFRDMYKCDHCEQMVCYNCARDEENFKEYGYEHILGYHVIICIECLIDSELI